MNKDLILYGDPHGDYAPLIDACSEHAPEAVIIAGDMTSQEAPTPIKESLDPLLAAGIPVYWVPGNHDTDDHEAYDATFGSYPEGNINGKVITLPSGYRVAGLGGVFRGKIWFPKASYEEDWRFWSPEDFVERSGCAPWRGGLDLRQRSSIFPSDADALSKQTADILITHEAPSSIGEQGFHGLDDLASDMDLQLLCHGHHHHSYTAQLMNGVHVRGLGLAEVVRMPLPVKAQEPA